MGLPNCLVTSCRIFRCFRLSSHRPLISFSFSVVPRNGTEYVGVQCLFVARSITLGFYFYCHIRYIFFCDINLQTLQIYVGFFLLFYLHKRAIGSRSFAMYSSKQLMFKLLGYCFACKFSAGDVAMFYRRSLWYRLSFR